MLAVEGQRVPDGSTAGTTQEAEQNWWMTLPEKHRPLSQAG